MENMNNVPKFFFLRMREKRESKGDSVYLRMCMKRGKIEPNL